MGLARGGGQGERVVVGFGFDFIGLYFGESGLVSPH